jgi:hypothetical protein
MARYIQSLHQLGQNYIESVVRGDRPIAERLEVIIRKYKSLKRTIYLGITSFSLTIL